MKNISQLRAISYAYSKRADENRTAFIIKNDGDLNSFKKSNYKSKFYYILNKWHVRIY